MAKQPQPKKVKPRQRQVTPDDAQRVLSAVAVKERQRRIEQIVKPAAAELVNPHYSLHLHIAWDIGMVTPYLDQWELEKILYAHIQQMDRFVIHRQDFIKRSGNDGGESWTICSIEFHDTSVNIPPQQLADYIDPFKLLESLGVNVRKRLKWPEN